MTPVAQPLRPTPFNLREKVESKIESLLALDIIEPVNGPTPWVNAAVIVPKENSDDIRLCIDMRRANEANIRGRHPIPTVDEVLQVTKYEWVDSLHQDGFEMGLPPTGALARVT